MLLLQAPGQAGVDGKAQEVEDEMRAGKDRQEAEAAQRYQQEHQKEESTAELDMFAEDVVATPPMGPIGTGAAPAVKGLTDNYDDPEGYYLFQVSLPSAGQVVITTGDRNGYNVQVVRAKLTRSELVMLSWAIGEAAGCCRTLLSHATPCKLCIRNLAARHVDCLIFWLPCFLK